MSSITLNHWGVGIPQITQGKLTAIKPHPKDNNPSPINDNLVDSVYADARIKRPAIRQSYLEKRGKNTTKQRGREPFIEVSWDKALDLISEDMNQIRRDYGNASIYGGSYGWGSAGRFHHAQSQLKRFLNCSGGFVRSEGNYSYNAALVLMPYIVGNFRDYLREATRFESIAKEGELVVMFGGVPLRNGQIGAGGMLKHRLKDELLACKRAGVEFINFSPLKSDALESLEAQWLAPIPGSDTAIMMGIAHTLLVENLHDTSFLERYTVGFDKVKAYLLGNKDGIPKSAYWASCQSRIDEKEIITLAHKMASCRTFISISASLQRAEFGEQPLWMGVTLSAMLGQIGLKGGGYGIAYGSDNSVGTIDRPISWGSLPQGHNKIDTFIPVAMITQMLLNPKKSYQYNGQTLTFPDIQLIYWAGGNPFHHHQDLNQLAKAFQKPQTIIVNEINWTTTARYADIVLPVTTTLERIDFGCGTQDNALIPMPRVIPPVGEARDEYDIFSELSKKMGFGESFTKGRTSDEWLKKLWSDTAQKALDIGVSLPDWESFLNGDVIELKDPNPDAVFLSDFRDDPDRHKLHTPSGKIELYSEKIASFDYDDCPPQASWKEPSEWLNGPLAKTYPIHMVSGQPATRLHSQLDNGAFSQSQKIKNREQVIINPKNASDRGINDGDIVMIYNDRGACLAGAKISKDIRQDVISLSTGAWYDPDFDNLIDDKPLDKNGNPNVLTKDQRTSRLSQGTAAHTTLVNIKKFEGEIPKIEAYLSPIK